MQEVSAFVQGEEECVASPLEILQRAGVNRALHALRVDPVVRLVHPVQPADVGHARHPEPELEIGGVGNFGALSADLTEHGRAHDHFRVADAVHAEPAAAREPRFPRPDRPRRHFRAWRSRRHLLEVNRASVGEADRWEGFEQSGGPCQGAVGEHVVGIELHDILAVDREQTLIERVDVSLVRRVLDDPDARVAPCERRSDLVTAVGGAVVHDEHVDVDALLCERAPHRVTEKVAVVEARHHHRDSRLPFEALGPDPAAPCRGRL